jgi:hypothetical protein
MKTKGMRERYQNLADCLASRLFAAKRNWTVRGTAAWPPSRLDEAADRGILGDASRRSSIVTFERFRSRLHLLRLRRISRSSGFAAVCAQNQGLQAVARQPAGRGRI